MARNANLDKAKLQAVGIYLKASPNAAVNHGEVKYSGGEYRVPEGAKSVYHGRMSRSELNTLVSAFQGRVRMCEEFRNSRGQAVRPNDLNRKRSGADPRARGELVPGRSVRAAGVHGTMGVTKLLSK